MVNGKIDANTANPAGKVPVFPVMRALLPGLEESILSEVFGLVRVAEKAGESSFKRRVLAAVVFFELGGGIRHGLSKSGRSINYFWFFLGRETEIFLNKHLIRKGRMAKAEKTGKIKVKKKKWFPILAPKFLGGKEIGESYLNQAEAAVGRMMKVNLRDLTGNIGDQNVSISLQIKEVTGSSLQTEITGFNYLPFFIRKLSRRNAGKTDDSFVLKTKDNQFVRLKPMLVTVFPVYHSVKTDLRRKIRELLEEEVEKASFESLLNDLLKHRLQMEFKKKLAKICPVKDVLIRQVKREEGKRAKTNGKGAKKEKKREEEGKEERGEENKGEEARESKRESTEKEEQEEEK